MTLKINTQEDEQRQLAVTIEVEESRINGAMKRVARKHARGLRIPGFRPGKAPYGVVLGYIGEESVRQDAVNELLPTIFNEALEEIDEQPYGQPTLDDVEFEPLVIKMTVPLEPVVVLGDYRAMRKEIEPVSISDEAVEEALEALVQQAATTEPVERASEMDDEIVIGGKGHIAGDEEDVIFSEEHFHVRLEEGNIFAETPFVSELVGLSAGDEKTFTFTFPEDHEEDYAGKEATFNVKVDEVLTRSVPELDDDFAKEQSGDEETLDELRAATADRLQKQAEEQQKNDLLDGFVDEVLENVEEMTYPQGAVEAEIDDMLNGLKQQIQQIGLEWSNYLEMRNETDEGVREEFEDDASSRLERRLIFQHLIENEKLALSEAEIDAAVAERLADYDEEMQGYMRPFLEGEGGNMLRNQLMMDKVHNRIVAILQGEAPDLDSLEDATESVEEEDGEVEEVEAEEAVEDSTGSEEAEADETETDEE